MNVYNYGCTSLFITGAVGLELPGLIAPLLEFPGFLLTNVRYFGSNSIALLTYDVLAQLWVFNGFGTFGATGLNFPYGYLVPPDHPP